MCLPYGKWAAIMFVLLTRIFNIFFQSTRWNHPTAMYSNVAGNGWRRTRIYLTVDIIIKKYSFSCNCSLKYGRFMWHHDALHYTSTLHCDTFSSNLYCVVWNVESNQLLCCVGFEPTNLQFYSRTYYCYNEAMHYTLTLYCDTFQVICTVQFFSLPVIQFQSSPS